MKFPWRKSNIDDPTNREGMTNLDISTVTTTSVEEAQPGCCQLFLQSCVNIIHLGQLIIGLILFGYGIVIALPHFRKDEKDGSYTHPNATIIIMVWSSVLIISSTTGVFSLTSTTCKRIGLVISAYAAIIIAVWNIIVALVLLLGIDHLIQYLKIHEKALYLSDGEIHHLRVYRFWYALVLALTALLEIWRYNTLPKIRTGLLRYDEARRFEVEMDENRRTAEDTIAWESNSDNHMRTPLLSSNDRYQEEISNNNNISGHSDINWDTDGFVTNEPADPWWKEPDETLTEEEQSKRAETKSWFARALQSPKKTKDQDKEKNNNSSSAVDDNDVKSDSSMIDFAPIDEENIIDSSPDIPWHQDDEGPSEPDLSWTKEEDS